VGRYATPGLGAVGRQHDCVSVGAGAGSCPRSLACPGVSGFVTRAGVGVAAVLSARSPCSQGWVADVLPRAAGASKAGGGSCFGDSGGPAFLGQYVVGDASFVNSLQCNPTGGYQRVDTPYAQAFREQFM